MLCAFASWLLSGPSLCDIQVSRYGSGPSVNESVWDLVRRILSQQAAC